MTKAAVIVLADTETHGDLARFVNAMLTSKEFAEAGDDVELIFDGAGTQRPGVLADRQMEMMQFNKDLALAGAALGFFWIFCNDPALALTGRLF